MHRSTPAALCRIAARSSPTDQPDRDSQLLRAFLSSRSETAFAELVHRHGTMVFAVCRRILGHTQDAEDAFQAAFFVLARKAGTVRGDNLAGWLYRVVVRTAQGVRIVRNRLQKREHAIRDTRREESDSADAVADSEHRELVAILDEELDRLPEHYRLPVVLCDLQGRSRKEAAAELKIPEGTLSSRLATAKRKLADRLRRRGLMTTGTAVMAALAEQASARVPEGLVRIATGSLPGSAVAALAAEGVVKSLFVAQLKGVLVAVGLATAIACGAFMMPGGTNGAAASGAEKPKSGPVDAATALVQQLGDPDFATRESVGDKLRALGVKAKPALQAGARDPNPEVAKRSREVLAAIKAAERQAFLAGKREPITPAWKRFKELVGDTKASRELFVEMMADDRRAELVEKAEASPAKAAEVYAAEVTRAADAGLKSYEQFTGQLPPQGQSTPMADASREDVPFGDAIAVLFLGTHSLPKGAKDPSASWALRASFADGVKGPQKEPLRKLFAAWLDRRTDPETIHDGLETALFASVPDALPIARRLVADPKLSAPTKGVAVLIVGNHGTKDDLPLLNACRSDVRPYYEYTTLDKNKQRFEIQVRDLAAAMSLHLSGQDFVKYGFQLIELHIWWVVSGPAPIKKIGWFDTGEARDAALKKAWDWLDAQPKPPAAPKPEKTMKQQGDPDFKVFLDLGVKALSVWLAEQKSK